MWCNNTTGKKKVIMDFPISSSGNQLSQFRDLDPNFRAWKTFFFTSQFHFSASNMPYIFHAHLLRIQVSHFISYIVFPANIKFVQLVVASCSVSDETRIYWQTGKS